VYEAFGDYDIVLRLWVPRATAPEDLGLAFDDALDALNIYQHEYMLVQSTLLHWVWQDVGAGDADAERPDEVALPEVSNDHVHELARYNSSAFAAANSSPQGPTPSIPKWVPEFEELNLLGAVPLDRRGIRFYVRFDHPKRPLRRPERESIARQISETCTRVAVETRRRLRTEDPERADDPVQLSLYVGSGPMTDYLIMARAPDTHFYSFARDLIFGLHELNLDRTYSMRTYTEIFADRNFVEFRELPEIEQPEIDAWVLGQPESESLEFKASFAFDVHRYLVRDEKEPAKVVTDSVVKAICGLLNAPLGGTLVIGALEIERELERVRDRDAAFHKLVTNYPIYPPAASINDLTRDAKVILGTEVDFSEWDKFVLKLEETLRNQITPYPRGFIDIRRLEVAGRTLAVVIARPSTTWFYAKIKETPDFFVRELASTRAYYGTEVDLYRRANPRGDLLP